MSYRQRSTVGTTWEQELAAWLTERGWNVRDFGQSQLDADAHEALRGWHDSYGRPSLIRWLPDLLVWSGSTVYMVDAKSETQKNANSPNVALELDAFDVGMSIEQVLNTPMLYGWECGGAQPRTVQNRHHSRLDGSRANGSGTAFLLMSKQHLTKRELVFTDKVR
jgi:hypothetical protein